MKYIVLILTAFFLLSGCSQKINTTTVETPKAPFVDEDSFEEDFENEFKESTDVNDPLMGYNRVMTSFNDKIYLYAYNPISKGYGAVVPQLARVGISNFFDNLKFPIHFTNNLLQLKFDHSMKELARFMINSSIGLLGFIDVAEHVGIASHEEDFGQTLGHYGVGSGVHIVLPFLGPSNLRDTLSLGVDMFASPISYTSTPYQIPRNFEEAVAVQSGYYINKNSLHLGEYESLKKDALDYYTFFRDAYEQKRDREIEK